MSTARASPVGLPLSIASSCANSSAARATAVPRSQRSSARRVGARARQAGRAARAAATASSTSAAPAEGAVAMTSPVAGLTTSKRSRLRASCSSPAMRSPCSRARNAETPSSTVVIDSTSSLIRYQIRTAHYPRAAGGSSEQEAPEDELELARAALQRVGVDPLAKGVHPVAAGDTERQRRDAARERGVRVSRARLEPVGKAELGAHRADCGEERRAAVEAARGPAAQELDRDGERLQCRETLERCHEGVERRLAERTALED